MLLQDVRTISAYSRSSPAWRQSSPLRPSCSIVSRARCRSGRRQIRDPQARISSSGSSVNGLRSGLASSQKSPLVLLKTAQARTRFSGSKRSRGKLCSAPVRRSSGISRRVSLIISGGVRRPGRFDQVRQYPSVRILTSTLCATALVVTTSAGRRIAPLNRGVNLASPNFQAARDSSRVGKM